MPSCDTEQCMQKKEHVILKYYVLRPTVMIWWVFEAVCGWLHIVWVTHIFTQEGYVHFTPVSHMVKSSTWTRQTRAKRNSDSRSMNSSNRIKSMKPTSLCSGRICSTSIYSNKILGRRLCLPLLRNSIRWKWKWALRWFRAFSANRRRRMCLGSCLVSSGYGLLRSVVWWVCLHVCVCAWCVWEGAWQIDHLK